MEQSTPYSLGVLVVDDNEDHAIATAKLLRHAFGCDSSICTTATEVFDLVFAQRPELLLVDLEMPKLDGFGVVEQLRLHRLLPALTVACSGYAGSALAMRCVVAGFHEFVAKPVPLEVLAALVAEATRRSSRASRIADAPLATPSP
jgi:CheY-like chemotaxis protein